MSAKLRRALFESDYGLTMEHAYRGARALILLHEQHMTEFLEVWRRARAADIEWISSDDPDYESPEALLCHVLGAARFYMVWMCEKLGLPEPAIEPTPSREQVEEQAEVYLNHLLERWTTPLKDVPSNRFGEMFAAPWGSDHCCEAMLEHAVAHPMRHSLQVLEWLGSS